MFKQRLGQLLVEYSVINFVFLVLPFGDSFMKFPDNQVNVYT